MKGSDSVEMNINIGGELIKLIVGFNDQNDVRDAEKEVNHFIERMRKSLHDNDLSDKKLIAMAAYQFANWYQKLLRIQEETIKIASDKCHLIDSWLDNSSQLNQNETDIIL